MYLIVWSVYKYDDHLVNDEVIDHWEKSHDLPAARAKYGELLKLDNLHSATICGVVKSTDYPTHNALKGLA